MRTKRDGVLTIITAFALVIAALPAMAQSSDSEGMSDLTVLHEKTSVTVTGNEDWKNLMGFGSQAEMVKMMTMMMVGGSGMEGMSMSSMKMDNVAPAPSASGGLQITATLKPNPPIVGDNTLNFLITDANGKPVAGLKLKASVAMTSMDMGTANPTVKEEKDGHYLVTAAFAMQGTWRVTIRGTVGKQTLNSAFDFDAGSKKLWVQPMLWHAALKNPGTVKIGKNSLEFTLLNPDGKPISGAKIAVEVAMTSMDMGVSKPEAIEERQGKYRVEAEFAMAGTWRVTLRITPPHGQLFVQQFDFDVKGQ